jgi:uncharacterized protein
MTGSHFKPRALAFLMVLVAQMPLSAQETIHSSVLEEDRILFIGLPDDYHSTTKAYPVFYKLDGDERSFAKTQSELKTLQDARQIPPMILVAIPNTDRDRDMLPVAIPGRRNSGGSDKFLRFVREEMIPFVEEHYRTSGFSIVMGTSNTALFAVYTFINQPSTFDAYLASSPMIGHSPELVRATTEALLSRKPRLDNSLYIIYGDEDSPDVTQTVPGFVAQIKANMPEGLRLEHVVLPGEGHVPASSLTRGTRWIFSDVTEP